MRVGSKVIDAREAAKQVLSGLAPGDQAALFAFDTRLACLKSFTSDFGSILGALDKADPPYGQTSLYDAVAETARAVAEGRAGGNGIPQRAALVVLTDGVLVGGAVDGDLAGFGFLGYRNRQGEDTAVIVGVDPVGVEIVTEYELAVEDAAGSFGSDQFDIVGSDRPFSSDGDDIAFDIQIDRGRVDAG